MLESVTGEMHSELGLASCTEWCFLVTELCNKMFGERYPVLSQQTKATPFTSAG